MSTLQMPNGDDHPEAATKHLNDANILLISHRADGAAYLSGYVVECALKSLWLLEKGVPTTRSAPWGKNGHRLTFLAAEAAAFASIAGAKSARYFKHATSGLMSSAIAAWTPELRYQAAKITFTDATAWYQVAKDVHDETIAVMRLDGVL